MLWLQPFPWLRWFLVGLLIVIAAWIELRPQPTDLVPFAVVDMVPGDPVEEPFVEFREVQAGVMTTADTGELTTRPISAGDPVLASQTGSGEPTIPADWWIIPIELPDGVRVGDPVRLILLETGNEVEGIIAHPGSDDPFAASDGGVAVPASAAAAAAIAASNGRVAVLISSG